MPRHYALCAASLLSMPVARSARTDTTLVDRLPSAKMRFSLALAGLLAEYELEAYPARCGTVKVLMATRRRVSPADGMGAAAERRCAPSTRNAPETLMLFGY